MIFKLCNFERYYRYIKEMESLFLRDTSTPMFIAALFTIAKYGNMCLLMEEQIKDIYTHIYVYVYIYMCICIYIYIYIYIIYSIIVLK